MCLSDVSSHTSDIPFLVTRNLVDRSDVHDRFCAEVAKGATFEARTSLKLPKSFGPLCSRGPAVVCVVCVCVGVCVSVFDTYLVFDTHAL